MSSEESDSEDDSGGGLMLVESAQIREPQIVAYIYGNLKQRYYCCRDWSPDAYVLFAYHGFMSVATQQMLVPEMQQAYCMLHWPDLHLGKKVRKALGRQTRSAGEGGRLVLSVDSDFQGVLDGICGAHGQNNWLGPEYAKVIGQLHAASPGAIPECASTKGSEASGFRYHSVEVFWLDAGPGASRKLVAGEVGYSIGSTYTSMTGFMDKTDPRFSHAGTFQLLALGKLLERCGYSFWNLGHPPDLVKKRMVYKADIGGKSVPRAEFLRFWMRDRKGSPSTGCWLGRWVQDLQLPALVLGSELLDAQGAEVPLGGAKPAKPAKP